MKKNPLLFCLVLFLAGFASAQNQTCPKIDVSIDQIIKSKKSFIFKAHVEGYDLSKLSFDWITTSGEIIDGQGTSRITILVNEDLTAAVKIKGLPEGCPAEARETVIDETRPVAVLVDEFGNIPYEEVEARLDSFFTALSNAPNAQGYIINYGTNREKSRREAHLKNRIAIPKYDASRVTIVRGGANPSGERGVWTKLWLVPPGSETPKP